MIVTMEKMGMRLVRPVARQTVAKTTVLDRVVNRRSYEEIFKESTHAALYDCVFHRVRFTSCFCRVHVRMHLADAEIEVFRAVLAPATCWYIDSEGCTGHSWYLYEKTSATCTSRGRVVYKCSICPGERIFSIHALGHDWGSWRSIDSSRHMRICRRCGLIQYEEHTMSDWKSHGDGNYSRRCPTCGYTQS